MIKIAILLISAILLILAGITIMSMKQVDELNEGKLESYGGKSGCISNGSVCKSTMHVYGRPGLRIKYFIEGTSQFKSLLHCKGFGEKGWYRLWLSPTKHWDNGGESQLIPWGNILANP